MLLTCATQIGVGNLSGVIKSGDPMKMETLGPYLPSKLGTPCFFHCTTFPQAFHTQISACLYRTFPMKVEKASSYIFHNKSRLENKSCLAHHGSSSCRATIKDSHKVFIAPIQVQMQIAVAGLLCWTVVLVVYS